MTRIFLHCIVSNKEQKLKVILEKKNEYNQTMLSVN